MSKIAERPRVSDLPESPLTPNAEEIRHELLAVLASPVFHGTKRCQRFLEYVCEQSLAGEAAALKERTVAVDVFGRSPHSDLSDDTIVRVGAREVRKRLAQYYVTEEGSASGVRIDLMPGSYAPEFRYVSPVAAKPQEPAISSVSAEPDLIPVPSVRTRRGWFAAAIGLTAVLAIAAFAMAKLSQKDPGDQLFTRFWEPVYEGAEPILLAVGNPIVYHPSARAVQLSESRLPQQKIPFQRVVQLPAGDVNGADMIPVLNQYVGFGDMVAATEISSMLARNNRGTRVRMSENVSFAEMKQAQSVLIGAFTNRWTMELEQSWKFQFGRTADSRAMIFDTGSAGRRQWSIPAQADGTTPQDYLLICRIRQSATGRFLVVGAGLKQFGTEAAGRLVADPAQLGVILAKLPPGWDTKNLQLVLLSRVIGGAPAQPELVASQIW